MNSPLVSVIVPCFNAAATLARTFESVRHQTYRPIEIIAVNDGSTDATAAALEREKARGVHVVTLERNGGSAAARNAAIAVAVGEFFAFIDSDDEWREDNLEKQIAMLAGNPAAVMVGCRAEVRRLDGSHELVNGDRQPTIGKDAWRILLHHSFFVPSSVVVRAEPTRRIGGFDISLRRGEDDQNFFIRLALEGDVVFVDQVMTVMYQQESSISRKYVSREHEFLLPMIEKFCADLRSRLRPREVRSILGSRSAQIGRNIYANNPKSGMKLIVRAMAYGDQPVANGLFLISASPWARQLKQRIGGAVRSS